MTALNIAFALSWRRPAQQVIVEPLAVSFPMVMLHVLLDDEAQMVLAERDDSIETLLFDGSYQPFGIAFRFGLLGGSRIGRTPPLFRISPNPRCRAGRGRESGAARSAGSHRPRPSSSEPSAPSTPRTAEGGSLRSSLGESFSLNHEEHEVAPESCQREHLDVEQIGSGEAFPVSSAHAPSPNGARASLPRSFRRWRKSAGHQRSPPASPRRMGQTGAGRRRKRQGSGNDTRRSRPGQSSPRNHRTLGT